MQCAAAHLSQFSEALKCEVCGQVTGLEANSVVELLRLSTDTAFSSRRSGTPAVILRQESGRERCRDHPDEDVAYYCFDCQTKCICSECVLQGPHKGHHVKSLRKSFPMLKGRVEDMVLTISSKLDSLHSLDHRLESSLTELDTQTRNITRHMNEAFQELHLLLVSKQKQLEEDSKAAVEEHVTHIQYYRKILSKRISWLQELMDAFQTVIEKNSQSEIIDFYTENVETVVMTKELEDAEMMQIERLGKMTYELDMSSAAAHIGSLQGLKLQIENLSVPREPLSSRSVSVSAQRRKETRPVSVKERLFESPI